MHYLVTSMHGTTKVGGLEDGDEYVVGVIEDVSNPTQAIHEATKRSRRSQEFWDGKELIVYPVIPTIVGGLTARRETYNH